MELALIVFGLIAVFFFYLTRRGIKAVRAYVYLAERSEGKSQLEANYIAARIDSRGAGYLNDAMRVFCRHCYGGRQLAMIAYAKSDGFMG